MGTETLIREMSPTQKQRLGAWLLPRLPFNQHVFEHIRTELNGMWVRTLHAVHPKYRKAAAALRTLHDAKVNVGCGPFGRPDWINLDIYAHPHVILRTDCRYYLPLGDESCRGIHVEHFLEHLNHDDERHRFLDECYRCLQKRGVLRVIVPDAERFVGAYLKPGWDGFRAIAAQGCDPAMEFQTKMDALNHVFIQNAEHYGGYDEESLRSLLRQHGFQDVTRLSFGTGEFPDGCIDREQHRPYSLYIEAVRPA